MMKLAEKEIKEAKERLKLAPVSHGGVKGVVIKLRTKSYLWRLEWKHLRQDLTLGLLIVLFGLEVKHRFTKR